MWVQILSYTEPIYNISSWLSKMLKKSILIQNRYMIHLIYRKDTSTINTRYFQKYNYYFFKY